MKKPISKSVKIGAFGLAMAILLYLGISFIKSQKIFSNDNTFYVEYNQVDGIEVSSPVLIKGFRVGTIDKISFDIARSKVIVKMTVDNEYPIPSDSRAKIASTSLLGGKVMEIVLGTSSSNYKSGDHLKSLEEKGLLDMAGGEYEKLKEQASNLVDKLSKALDGVNSVLSEDNVANISQTLASLKATTANLNSMLANQKSNFENTIANMSSISDNLNKEIPKLGVTLDNFNKVSTSFAAETPELLSKANQAINNLNNILAKASSTDGTLGKLVNDAELYNNLTNASNALNQLLEDIKENPGEYINISVFGGKKK